MHETLELISPQISSPKRCKSVMSKSIKGKGCLEFSKWTEEIQQAATRQATPPQEIPQSQPQIFINQRAHHLFFSRMRVFLCVHACYLLDSNRVIYIGRESASLFSSSHACINKIADDGMPTLASLCHTRDSSLLSSRVMREDQNPTQPLSSRRVLKNIWVISHLYRSKFQSKKHMEVW